MNMRANKKDIWNISESLLDLFQEKLMKLQRFFDLSVCEREALHAQEIKELVNVLNEKSNVQSQVSLIDERIKKYQQQHTSSIQRMNAQQSLEMKEAVQVMVDLLQKIVDYEEENKIIALTVKSDLQKQMGDVTSNDKMINSYFGRRNSSPRYIDQAR